MYNAIIEKKQNKTTQFNSKLFNSLTKLKSGLSYMALQTMYSQMLRLFKVS